MSGYKEYNDLLNNIKNNLGQLDCVLHNAALLGELVPIAYANINTWHEVFQVNLNSVFLLTQTLLPLLKQSKQAKIIFTLDEIATVPQAYWGAYAISKNAVRMFAQILSEELENISNIKVHTIEPGIVATTMRRKAFPAEILTKLTLTSDILDKYISVAI